MDYTVFVYYEVVDTQKNLCRCSRYACVCYRRLCVCVYFILAKSKTIKVYEQCPRVVDVDLKLTVIICK